MARSVKLDFSISMNIGARAQFVRLWNIPPNIQSPPLLLGRAFEVFAKQGLVFTSKDIYFLHFYIIVFRICICVSITHSAPRTQPCISRATCFEFLYLAFFLYFEFSFLYLYFIFVFASHRFPQPVFQVEVSTWRATWYQICLLLTPTHPTIVALF